MRAIVAIAAVLAVGCAPEPIKASFTSRVVQHETCKVTGDHPETCHTAETLLDVKVRIVEEEGDNVWLLGLPRSGVEDRALLGSNDDEGGWLFVDEVSQSNTDSDCTLKDRLEISVTVDPKADPDTVGTDDCIALVGRELVTTDSTEGCDAVNVPPLKNTLIARKRWEPSPSCKP